MAIPSFSYSVSRKYPYKWFSWFVIIGGTCAAVFFSAVNVAADGYVLKLEYTFDYNQTVAARRWTQRFPFTLVDRSDANCQAQLIEVNSQFLTNNSALQYTLTGAAHASGILPALEYTNNLLENCTVEFIEIDLESSQRTASQQGWGPWGPKAFAQLSCLINNNVVPTTISLTVAYEFLTPTIETGEAFTFVQPPSNQTDASLWWGQSLLSWNWLNLANVMAERHNDFPGGVITQGSIIFHSSTSQDMTDLNFFSDISYHFVTDSNGQAQCCLNPAGHNYSVTIGNLAAHNQAPNIWIQADSLAKSFYATIMADLGQKSASNMLVNDTALDYFSANLTNNFTGQDMSVVAAWLATNPAMQKYSSIKNTTGSLFIDPSTIAAQYLCQIPKLKSGGSLFVTILIADLVFLQAMWKILNAIMAWKLGRDDSTANYCEGCKAQMAEVVELDLTNSAPVRRYDSTLRTRPKLVAHESTESRSQLLPLPLPDAVSESS